MPNSITIRQVPGKPGQVYYPLQHTALPASSPGATDVVVSMRTAALNHRDLFVRQHLYPGTTFGVPLLADGCGIVTAAGTDKAAQAWLGKRVVVAPCVGWQSDPDGPEGDFAILGGTKFWQKGTLCDELVVGADLLEEAPAHLDDAEAAALPLTGLTAWRAARVKCGARNVGAGCNVLVTGIGGGVAVMALLFCVAAGAHVYVTSGSAAKIEAAVRLGAKGGVSYKDKAWEKTLLGMLAERGGRKAFDAVIDGAGGDVVDKATKLLKAGGVLSQYGMTVSPKMTWSMPAVLKNVELKGSTMGSRAEFSEMIGFVRERGLRPVVSSVAEGGLADLDGVDRLFEEMRTGSQFGKLVVRISAGEAKGKL